MGVRACSPHLAFFPFLKEHCHGNQLRSKNRRFTISVTSGPVTPEFTLLTITPFMAILQKSAHHAKYLRISQTYLDLLYTFGSHIGGNDYPDICLAVTQGTLLWQPVKLRRCSQTSRGTTFTLCFGVRQRIS